MNRSAKPRSADWPGPAGRGLELDTDVQFVKGVGPRRAAQFASLGVRTVGDLIEYLPFRHEHLPKSQSIDSLRLDTVATVVGALHRVRTRPSRAGRVLTARIIDGTGWCRVRWFHSPYLTEKLRDGLVARVTGKVEVYLDHAQFTNPQLRLFDERADPMEGDVDRYVGVYSGTAELDSPQIARIIAGVLDQAADQVIEILPDPLRAHRRLPPRRTAIVRYHRPTHPDDIGVAHRRLAYDELLVCQLAVQLSRRRLACGPPAHPIEVTEEIDRRIRRRFPFALTADQNQAVAEIRSDLARPIAMNRMLHADVGAGKTAVAVYAALAVVANRRRAAFLAPTEVLAVQHRVKIEQYLQGSRVRIGFLAGSLSRAERLAELQRLQRGEIDLVIGTHALIEEDVRIPDLGLVIIDEQHKFGVAQRARLRCKGQAPHALVLTATPIPRTLAMTVFGDLDVSTMRGTMPNRQPVVTRLIPPAEAQEAWAFVRSRLSRGEQAYVVYPLIEESDSLPLQAAGSEAQRLSEAELRGFRVGLLHGRLKAPEKAEVMDRFRRGELHALVSTTVIEVGVDVPAATVMVIHHAERFGLSQLHQLRGRIGRGGEQSFCLLIADATSEDAVARLDILCQTADGFRIAEEDLRLRGPGEMLGTRQHGLPAFRVADLVADFELLEQARDDAAALLRADPYLTRPEHAALKQAVLDRFGAALNLVDVA